MQNYFVIVYSRLKDENVSERVRDVCKEAKKKKEKKKRVFKTCMRYYAKCKKS